MNPAVRTTFIAGALILALVGAVTFSVSVDRPRGERFAREALASLQP